MGGLDSVLISKFVGLDMVTILNLAQKIESLNTGSNWFIFYIQQIKYILFISEKNQLIMIS